MALAEAIAILRFASDIPNSFFSGDKPNVVAMFNHGQLSPSVRVRVRPSDSIIKRPKKKNLYL